MLRNIFLVITLMCSITAFGDSGKSIENPAVLKISVLSSNIVLLNGKEIGLEDLAAELKKAKSRNGSVWYYRENASAEPPPAALQVIKMVVENELSISMSTKSDFSDYVGANGKSLPR